MSIIETLLANLPQNLRTQTIYTGENWVLALLCDEHGRQYAGVASAPHDFPDNAGFPIGQHSVDEDAAEIAQLLRSKDISEASAGLATVNALIQLENNSLSTADAADWLAQTCTDRKVAVFGRFPFVDDEVRPFAKEVRVFEQNPAAGEYHASQMPEILPQVDVVAITGSTINNHTIDDILTHTVSGNMIVIIGPSTPLTAKLFDLGINALFGVQVVDIEKAIASVQVGSNFRKMQGLRRVSLFKTEKL